MNFDRSNSGYLSRVDEMKMFDDFVERGGLDGDDSAAKAKDADGATQGRCKTAENTGPGSAYREAVEREFAISGIDM